MALHFSQVIKVFIIVVLCWVPLSPPFRCLILSYLLFTKSSNNQNLETFPTTL